MIPPAILGMPRSAFLVFSDAWHRKQAMRAYTREAIDFDLLQRPPYVPLRGVGLSG